MVLDQFDVKVEVTPCTLKHIEGLEGLFRVARNGTRGRDCDIVSKSGQSIDEKATDLVESGVDCAPVVEIRVGDKSGVGRLHLYYK